MSKVGFDWRAGSQAALILLVVLGAVHWTLELKRRPADVAQLHILASRLQSQAAEATALANRAAGGDVQLPIARRHAAQLAHQTATTSEQLTTVHVRPADREAIATLRDIAADLDRQLGRFQSDEPDAASFDQLAQRAQALDDRLARPAQ
jgi:hypothetical protein